MSYKKSTAHFFWTLLKPYKWHYLLVPLAPFILGTGPILTIYALSLATEKLSHGATTIWEIMLPMAMILAHQLAVIACFSLHFFLLKKIMAGTKADAIKLLYHHVQHYPYSFFGKKPLGELQNQFSELANGWERVHGLFTYRVLMPGITFLMILGTIIYYDPLFALVITTFTCLFFFLMLYLYLSPRRRKLLKEEAQASNSLLAYMSDLFRHMEILFAFRTHKRELLYIYDQADRRVNPSIRKVYQADSVRVLLGGLLYLTMTILILFYVGFQAIQGNFSSSLFLKLSLLSFEILRVLWGFTYSTAELTRNWWKISEQLNLLKEEPREKMLEASFTPKKGEGLPILSIKNIDYCYRGQKRLFQNFSIDLAYGEKVGIVGPSGGGKSTLTKLIMGYFPAKKGSIMIGGAPIEKLPISRLRDMMVLIPQNPGLFNRSLFDNIRYGKPTATKKEVIAAAKKAEIHHYITQLPRQYDTLAGENGEALSGGEKQRIAIARAILKNPPLLILDEATSALDSHTEIALQRTLKKLFQQKKISVLAIAHRLSTVKDMDRLLVMDQGKVIEAGTHQELIKKEGLYTKMCKVQEGVSFF